MKEGEKEKEGRAERESKVFNCNVCAEAEREDLAGISSLSLSRAMINNSGALPAAIT